MPATLPAFTPLEDSLWLMLYARALDSRRPHPILADAVADQIVHRVDYDFGQLHIDTNLILNVALRAKKLDQMASEFLGALTSAAVTRHAASTGRRRRRAGSRAHRAAPAATVLAPAIRAVRGLAGPRIALQR